jgi:putative membrane protein
MNYHNLRDSFLALAASMHRAPVTRRLVLTVAVVAIYAAGVSVSGALVRNVKVHFEPDIHSFVGFVLGLLLVFRTNTAYERWWEGRKLWGQLVNDSRNLSVKVSRFGNVPQDEILAIGRLIVDFAYSLRHTLQDSPRNRTADIGSAVSWTRGTPVEIVGRLYDRVKRWADAGHMDGFQVAALDVHMRAFLDIVGGCERIRRTRLSISYRAFVRQCIFLYLLLLPWCLIESYGFWTILATIIVSYFMVGIEIIAETVEQPFGSSDDHIPLDEICNGLADSIREIVEPRVLPVELAAEVTTSRRASGAKTARSNAA